MMMETLHEDISDFVKDKVEDLKNIYELTFQ